MPSKPVPELLRASHIVPWAGSEEHRANPGNGLCLAATFDRGLISLDEEFRVLLHPRLEEYLPKPEPEATFVAAAGRSLRLPEKNWRIPNTSPGIGGCFSSDLRTLRVRKPTNFDAGV